ncbi:MAG: hypothetical protein P4L81_03210 [Candidatus Pacebacteria bacterium]|nr:hypothetical protein [Candidatus Paceibacterota bacterium]
MADAPATPNVDLDAGKLLETLQKRLPEVLVLHQKVRIIFEYVTPHPVTGEDVPITPQVVEQRPGGQTQTTAEEKPG